MAQPPNLPQQPMNTMAVQTDPASDSQCDLNKCNRRLGSSVIFKSKLLKIGSKKYLAKKRTGTQFMILEDLITTFHKLDALGNNIFETEHTMVESMRNGLQLGYDDVFKGTTSKLTIIPPKFQFSQDMTMSIKGLEDRIKTEKAKVNTSQYNEGEIKKMENVLQNMKGEVAESKVYSELEKLWCRKRGVLLHSFHPEHILSQLTKRAKAQRQNRSSLDFTDLEEKLAEILNIDTKAEATEIMNIIKANNPNVGSLTRASLENELEQQKQIGKKKRGVIIDTIRQTSKAMKKQNYLFDEAQKAVSIGLLHHLVKPDGEVDYIGILADERLILNFEVKYQIADAQQPPTKLLADASKQTKHNEEYLARVFGPLFSSGWRLIKVAIIMQQGTTGTLEENTPCLHCKPFVVTSGSLDDMESWVRQTLPNTSVPVNTGLTDSYREFLKFFEIAVASISSTYHMTPWAWIEGSNYTLPIAAGHTPVQKANFISKGSFGTPIKGTKALATASPGTSNKLTLVEAMTKFHDAEKLLFFSSLQLSLLSPGPETTYCLFTILLGDYGTGRLILILQKS